LKWTLSDERQTFKFGDDKFGDDLRFKVTIENQSAEHARVAIIDPYYQNRPKLWKNGTLVTYQARTGSLARSKDQSPDLIRLIFVSIGAQSSKDLLWLDLREWYGALPPGSYRLTNRYRTSVEGPWTKDSVEIQLSIVKEH
jgi:hypothetical protein